VQAEANYYQGEEMNKDERKQALKHARAVLYRLDSSSADMAEAIGFLPKTGHKAMALRLRLEARIAGRPYGWSDI